MISLSKSPIVKMLKGVNMTLAEVLVLLHIFYDIEFKKPLAYVALQVIVLRCFRLQSSTNALVWDPTTEHWEDFHIRYCGLVCVNGSFKDLHPEVSKCMWPRCFHCDCHQTCSVLDTCCPHGTILSDGSFQRQENKISRTNSLPPYPYQIECASIPYKQWGNFLQVLDCPQDDPFLSLDLTEGRKKNLKEMCVQNYTEETDLDYILPYVDVEIGLVFRNKFCSLCNGYSVISSDELSESNNVRTAVPWNLKVTCTHYQDIYHVSSLRKFIDQAQSSMACKDVVYDKCPAKVKPRTCFPPVKKHEWIDTCEEPLRSSCLKYNNTYLGLENYRNIFCFMCTGSNPSESLCYLQVSKIIVVTNKKRRERIAPLSLLLGVTGSRPTVAFQEWLNCSSEDWWVDENVSGKNSNCRDLIYLLQLKKPLPSFPPVNTVIKMEQG